VAEKAKPSVHGATLGRELARLADSQVVDHPEIRSRCMTCAFREGTMPNMMAPTLLQAMHCVLGTDPSPFGCHHTLDANGIPTQLCAGYELCKEASFEDAREAVGRASANLNRLCAESSETAMEIAAFDAWRITVDPEDRLDDYAVAKLFATSGVRI